MCFCRSRVNLGNVWRQLKSWKVEFANIAWTFAHANPLKFPIDLSRCLLVWTLENRSNTNIEYKRAYTKTISGTTFPALFNWLSVNAWSWSLTWPLGGRVTGSAGKTARPDREVFSERKRNCTLLQPHIDHGKGNGRMESRAIRNWKRDRLEKLN